MSRRVQLAAGRLIPALMAWLLLGCGNPIAVEWLTETPSEPVRRLAVMPIEIAPPEPASRRATEPDGPAVVGSRLVEALTLWSGTPFVPPDAVAHWLEADRESRRPVCGREPNRRCLAAALAKGFDVDALLHTTLHRYAAREGSAVSVSKPAAVWLEIELRTPGDVILWRGSYDETQKSLSDDLGSLRRAYERGFSWVSVESLASYGTRELVQRLDVELRRWK